MVRFEPPPKEEQMNKMALALIINAGIAIPASILAQEVGTEPLGMSLDSLLGASVSTASKYSQTQKEAPAFVTIVTQEEIRKLGYRTLEEVLQNQVGFTSGNDREYSDITVRGFGRPGYYNNKVLLLVDGHSLNDSFSGGARVGGALGIDMGSIDRVEIVRGPGSALYGARAMLAVINLVTRKGRDIDGFEAMGGWGEHGARTGSVQYGKVIGQESDLMVATSWGRHDGEDLYFPELDSPQLNGGWARDLDQEEYVRSLVTWRSGAMSLQAAFSNRRKGIPTAAYQTTFNHPAAENRDRSGMVELSYEKLIAPGATLTLRGFADSYDNDGAYPFGPAGGGGPVVHSGVNVRSFGGEVRMEWEPSLSQRVVFGLEALDVFEASQSSDSEEVIGGDFPYRIWSGFLHEEFQVTERLAVTLGLRRDQYSSSSGATTPRAAVVFHTGDQDSGTVKLLYGEAFRAPNLLELHITSEAAALRGNPNLMPERIRTVEAVWEQNWGSVVSTMSLFHNEIRDLIDLVEVRVPDPEREFGRLAFEQQNISSARSNGFEVEVRAPLPSGATTRLSYAYVKATDAQTQERLVNVPTHQARVFLSSPVGRWVEVGLGVRAETERRNLYGSESDSVLLLDLTATSTPLFRGLSLQVAAHNLLDREYGLPGGFQHVQSAIPQPGRQIGIQLAYGW